MSLPHIDIIKAIQSGKLAPVYLLGGEEPFFVDRITRAVEYSVLKEEEKGFNQTVLYGRDVSMNEILAEARQFPMMSDYRVVIVKEAQNINFGLSGDKSADDDDNQNSEKLLSYCKNPNKTTVLVIAMKGKSFRKDSKIVKAALASGGLYFKSEALRVNDMPDFVKTVAGVLKFRIDEAAVRLIAENIGTDPGRVFNEFEKLKVAVGNNGHITEEVVERNIGISRTYNAFELTKAINNNDITQALKITDYFTKNSKTYPIQMLLPMMYPNFVRLLKVCSKNMQEKEIITELKINPYTVKEYVAAQRYFNTERVKKCIALFREYDLKSKGIGSTASDSELFREFILRILF